MSSTKLFYVAILTWLAKQAIALDNHWMIDDSCGAIGTPMNNFVQNAMENALAMAYAANSAVSGQSVSPAIQTVLDFLFYPTPPDGTPRDLTFGVTQAQVIFDTPEGITRFGTGSDRQVFDKAHLLDNNDVKLYCDQSRIVFRDVLGESKPHDTDTNRQLSEDDYSACNLISTSPTFMYTATTKPTDDEVVVFKQIQICPDFLTYALPSVPYQNKFTALLDAQFWKKGVVSSVDRLSRLRFAPVDAYALFDKTLVHELTHATSVAPTIDVSFGDGSCCGLINGFDLAYGWQRCRDLSTVVSVPSVGNTAPPPFQIPPLVYVYSPEVNADSWALFASIAYALDNNRITGVNQDGTFVYP